MRSLARVLRRLADRLDPQEPYAVNVTVNFTGTHPVEVGREIEKALLAHARRTGR